MGAPVSSNPKGWLKPGFIYHLRLKQTKKGVWGGKLWEGDQEKYGRKGLFNKVC